MRKQKLLVGLSSDGVGNRLADFFEKRSLLVGIERAPEIRCFSVRNVYAILSICNIRCTHKSIAKQIHLL